MYRYNIYKARKDFKGAASQFEFRADENKGYVFFWSSTNQKDGEEQRFDWENKINFSMGVSDLESLLSVFQRRTNESKLFHESPGGGNKILEVQKYEDRGYTFKLSHKNGDQVNRVGHLISHQEAASLAVLLENAILRACYVKDN
jgi:hypothetical protein